MSAPAWTPGPWAIMDEADPDLTVMSQATDCEMICHIPDVDFDSDAGTPHPVNAANARLIAAAPDLVEALKYGLDLYGYDGPDGPWPIEKRREFDRMARAALAKARGQ